MLFRTIKVGVFGAQVPPAPAAFMKRSEKLLSGDESSRAIRAPSCISMVGMDEFVSAIRTVKIPFRPKGE